MSGTTALNTYSFLDVQASMTGPGVATILGQGAGAAEEGISYEFLDDKDAMTIGADGTPMHSLHAGKAGTVTVRLLKTSPMNFVLQAAYDFQSLSSANWGQNVIVVSNSVAGDIVTCSSVAFKRQPANTYAKDANIMEWSFNAGRIDPVLGAGVLLSA